MLREYCDKCHKEIPIERKRVKDDDGNNIDVDQKYVVRVLGALTAAPGDYGSELTVVSEDVLCEDCVKNFNIGDPTD